MAQFDVHRSKSTGRLLVDVQHNALIELETRIVAPLLAADTPVPISIPRLHPQIEIGDERYVLGTHLMGATRTSDLGTKITTLHNDEYRIQAALDVLLTGV